MKFEQPKEGDTFRRYTNREAKRLRTSRRRVLRQMRKDKRKVVDR